MTSFIGLPGALAEIACPVSEDTSMDRSFTELVPFSGERIVQLGKRVRRSWSVEYGVEHPRDYAVLDALTRWDSPLVWVGALAQATNLLTPEQATLLDASFSGGASLRRGLISPGGIPAVSWAGGPAGSAVGVAVGKPVPVIGGVPVTVSAWTQRAGAGTSTRLAYTFYDATGASIGSGTLSGIGQDGWRRVSWTLTPPEGAAAVSVLIRDAAMLAHPQVTWTPAAVDYAPGRGVHRVVVLPGSESPIIAHSRQVLTSAGYTIMEVG